jgi:hypothetical protein
MNEILPNSIGSKKQKFIISSNNMLDDFWDTNASDLSGYEVAE